MREEAYWVVWRVFTRALIFNTSSSYNYYFENILSPMEPINTPSLADDAMYHSELDQAKETPEEGSISEAGESGGLRRNHKRLAKTEGREAMKVTLLFFL